jgi:hypothetical protein
MSISGPQNIQLAALPQVQSVGGSSTIAQHAISRSLPAIAQIVLLCALPLIIPALPAIMECATRLAVAPFLAIHHMIVLNYTLFKHSPPHFLSTAIKANLLFLKGFILNLLPFNTTSCLRNYEDAASRAYAEMYILAMRGDIGHPELLERMVEQQQVRFPSFFSTQLDLREQNRERMANLFIEPRQLPPTIPPSLLRRPADIHASQPHSARQQRIAPRQIDPAPRQLPPTLPPSLSRRPSDVLASQPHSSLRQRIATKQIDPAHYHIHAESLVIPPAPAINLGEAFASLWSICEESWPDNFRIQDDNNRVGKHELAGRLERVFAHLEVSNRYISLTEESTTLIKNVLGHILNNFKETNQQIEEMPRGVAKQRALRNLQRDLRLFFQRLGVTFNHCNDRTVTGAIEYYSEYILRRPLNPDAHENEDLERSLYQRLQQFRRDKFQRGYEQVDTNEHDAATERYAKVQLNNELGLGYPDAIGAHDNFANFALPQKVAEIRQKFLNLYTPQTILNELKRLIRSDQLYMKIVNWFENQNPPKQAADVFDDVNNEFKDAALIELLEKLHVIQ